MLKPGISATASSQFPRPRTLIHPGRFNPVRIQSKHAEKGRHIRLALQPGWSLFDAMVKPLAEIGVRNASTTILGGFFADLYYCVAPPDPSHKAVIAYTQPIRAGRTYMIFGNATLGRSAQGKPLVHCHAAIRTEDGRTKGGHILPDSSIVGSEPIPVLVTSLDGFELRETYDPETNISLLQPREEEDFDE
jgi:predicted DNA-binding protein with PD1-like motif